MPPPPHTKPENVLKRAQELIGVGNQADALHTLHEHVTSKRTRNSPIASLEPVMLLFIELCVDLRKGKMAKDGLYNYKNTSQNTNVATIELVFRKFIELAEQKVKEAQAKADEVSTAADAESSIANVGDLEASETPESILLSTVSGEQSKDRTDRAIVTPWLKFLWETYRTVLDIFKNNARLEVMYQTTAHQAFQFCSRYQRKTEFRRLCELLRNHLQNAAKYASQMHAINLSDPDTLQRHLDTRFEQLNVAVELELWQEAFKSVEDTHTLLNLSKRPAKSSMMANYFEKLTRIFMVSENYLFHAAAWSRYYNLLRQSAALVGAGHAQKKDHPTNITDADLTTSASFVILSALAIPVISTSRSRGALIDLDEARKNRNTRLTTLLGMSQSPTRAILFKDALSKGLLHRARPEIRELYNILEVEFHPLSICKRISPILSKLGADADMEKYVIPLQQVILTRLFQQLSQVYETVELDFVLKLANFPAPFELSRNTVEKFIMNGCKKGDLSIRIDHATSVLTFDSDVFSSAKSAQPAPGSGPAEVGQVQRLQSTPSEIVRSQLTRLSKALFITCQYVDPSFNAERQSAKQAAQERAASGAEAEHRDALNRRDIIQKRKETAATVQAAREQEEAKQKRLKAIKQQEAEVQRLADEQKEREARRLRTEQQRVQREEIAKQIKDIQAGGIKGVDLDKLDLDDLDSARLRQLKLQALEKEKNEIGEKLRVTAKRLDHLERAYRQEEIKHLPEDYDKQSQADLVAYETAREETLEAAKAKHASDVELKGRLSRLLEPYEEYKRNVEEQRKAEFGKRHAAAERELNEKIAARKVEFRERRIRERREQEEQARLQAEQAEREREEAERKEREEQEKRERLEREKAERQKSDMKADAIAAQQRQREEEAEQKAEQRRLERMNQSAMSRPMPERSVAPAAAETPSSAPRLPLPGLKPSWREREAQKQAESNGTSSSATSEAAAPDSGPARKPSAYVPRQLRGTAGESDAGDRRASGASPLDKWQPKRGPPADKHRSGSSSPAPGAGSAMQRPSIGGRTQTDERRESGSAPAPTPGGAYRPGAFKARKDGPGAPPA